MNKWHAISVVAVLTGCGVGPNQSYVSTTGSQTDAAALAAGIAEFVSYRIPSGGTLSLAPLASAPASDSVTPMLAAEFEHQQLTVVPASNTAPEVHRLRYLVTPLDTGDLVRVTLDGASGAQFFARDAAGSLAAADPYSMTEAAR